MKKYIKSSWTETQKEHLDPKLSQQIFTSQNVMVVHYIYEPGLEFEKHSHPQEQVTIIQTGRLVIDIEGEKVELGEGDICAIAPNVAHSTIVLGNDYVDSISIFTPITEKIVFNK